MITITNTDVYGWEAAIRGMRNPLESWEKSDSEKRFELEEERELADTGEHICQMIYADGFAVGNNDRDLMLRLAKAGSTHAKYRRMITVTCDITAPLYWWKEFDTYKIGTVANSCSTMHKIHARDLTLDDFSCEHLTHDNRWMLEQLIHCINKARHRFVDSKDKTEWWQMIQLLPTSFNQKRTVMLNYEVLTGMYRDRKHHKLDEWRTFCEWIEQSPFSEIITG